MKKLIFTIIVLLCSFLVYSTALTDISGKWAGTLRTYDGSEFPLAYSLKIDGDRLTGTGLSPQGELPITEGKMSGTDFTFYLSVDGEDVKHAGKYYATADSIGLDIYFDGNKLHSVLTRSVK